jgi:NADH dehydrogenase
MQILPRPLITRDQVIQLGIDNVVSDAALRDHRTLAAFGIVPTSMGAVLPTFMWRFRKHGQFDRQPA